MVVVVLLVIVVVVVQELETHNACVLASDATSLISFSAPKYKIGGSGGG